MKAENAKRFRVTEDGRYAEVQPLGQTRILVGYRCHCNKLFAEDEERLQHVQRGEGTGSRSGANA